MESVTFLHEKKHGRPGVSVLGFLWEVFGGRAPSVLIYPHRWASLRSCPPGRPATLNGEG
eukprot:2195871-Pyramimonas_sp.AAC.1